MFDFFGDELIQFYLLGLKGLVGEVGDDDNAGTVL